MKTMLVSDGVGKDGKDSYGETYWVNHIFMASDATILRDGKINTFGLDHTSLCGKNYGALNYYNLNSPYCFKCAKIADKLGYNRIEENNV